MNGSKRVIFPSNVSKVVFENIAEDEEVESQFTLLINVSLNELVPFERLMAIAKLFDAFVAMVLWEMVMLFVVESTIPLLLCVPLILMVLLVMVFKSANNISTP